MTNLAQYGSALVLVMAVVLGLSNMAAADGADAVYIFGDSYMDTGNVPQTTPPYGEDWPGYPDGRWSDGRNLADYFAALFGLPTPPIDVLLKNNSAPLQGINFALSGAGVTYAFGVFDLDYQVDTMEALVKAGVLTKAHLKKSVIVINIGINDYDSRNLQSPFQESAIGAREQVAFVHTVVNGIAINIVRLHSFGIRNIVVLNLPLLVCIPQCTMEVELDFRACSTNMTLVNETSLHNLLLQERVKMLNKQLNGLHVVIADLTKAMQQLFYHGSDYGFENPLTPCCCAKNSTMLYILVCGQKNNKGQPVYTLCKDPSKAVLWDTIHPTEAAAKALVTLFASVPGYTLEGPDLNSWIKSRF